MAICNAHRNWFRLKCPYPYGSKEYSRAYANLDNATYRDVEKLKVEFDDGSTPFTHHYINKEWVAVIGSRSKPSPALNMKAIQRHGHKYRVQKRSRGQLRKWTSDTLKEAVAKRDAMFG
jgi:hypothetical protein